MSPMSSHTRVMMYAAAPLPYSATIAPALIQTSRSVTRRKVGNEAEDRIEVIRGHAGLLVDDVTGVPGSKERFHASDGVVEVRCLVHAGRLCAVTRFGQTMFLRMLG
jgi:hypothetical protein